MIAKPLLTLVQKWLYIVYSTYFVLFYCNFAYYISQANPYSPYVKKVIYEDFLWVILSDNNPPNN